MKKASWLQWNMGLVWHDSPLAICPVFPFPLSHWLCWVIPLFILHGALTAGVEAAPTSPIQAQAIPQGLHVQFDTPPLRFAQQPLAGQRYDTVSFEGARFEYEDGYPLLPYYTALIGIPTDGAPNVTLLDSVQEVVGVYRILPVQPEFYRRAPYDPETGQSPSSFHETAPLLERYPGFYPPSIVRVEPIGYVRQQRLARIQIFPLQYDVETGQLRLYRHIEFRIEFPTVPAAPTPAAIPQELPAFEATFQASLLNYEQARGWRLPRPRRKYTATQSANREIFKLYLRKDGVYRITQEQLALRSESLVHEDPRYFQMFNAGEEVPILVEGEEDGRFDPGDAILFYGQELINQKFTEENAYILTVGTTPGLRAQPKDGAFSSQSVPIALAFKVWEHHEKDVEYDPLLNVRSELVDHYFWVSMNGTAPNTRRRDIEFTFPHSFHAPEEEGLVRIQLQGISYKLNEKHDISVIFNGEAISTAEWFGQDTYQIEQKVDQWLFNPDQKNYITLLYEASHGTPPTEKDIALDWIEFEYWRSFQVEGDRLLFSNETIPRPPGQAKRYRIGPFSTDQIRCFQVQDGKLVAEIVGGVVQSSGEHYTFLFEEPPGIPRTHYYALANFQSGLRIIKDTASNLRAAAHEADYVIITHETFLETSQRLAEFRRSQGHKVLVVDVQDIYDEFSYGLFNPRAIQGFLRYAYHNWALPPTYVLLIGDAHYDYKQSTVRIHREYYNQDYDLYPIYEPTYHGWSPEGGETAMDHRFVTVSGDDSLPDMAIGRLPVQSNRELDGVIDKIIAYETSTPIGEWQGRIMEVADNGIDHPGDDEFERSRRLLIEQYIPVGYDSRAIYLGQINSPWETNRQIMDTLNEGVVIGEYSGHGGRETWADEGIFRIEDISRLRNRYKPWILTTTCLNGMFDFPGERGRHTMSEEFLLLRDRGAIAALSATRLTYAQANSLFDQDLFEHLFKIRPPHLGLIVMQAKTQFLANAVTIWIPGAEQYTLFGDPATPLAIPPIDIPTELQSVVVDPSQQLVIQRNQLLQFRLTPEGTWIPEIASGFNGNLVVHLVHPNNRDAIPGNDLPNMTRRISVVNGEFGDIRLTLPTSSIAGEGIVRLFAQSQDATAIGGARFSVYRPVIVGGPEEELTETDLRISVRLVDNKGDEGIGRVVCNWRNTVDHIPHTTEMKRGADGWYHLVEPIPLPAAGRSIRYSLVITDSEGHTLETKEKAIAVPVGANLAIWKQQDTGAYHLEYRVANGQWEIISRLSNTGGRHVVKAFDVYFFDGNPDQDGNLVVDEDAVPLGHTRVMPEEWQPGEHDNLQIVDVRILMAEPLASGIHQIYIWADPQWRPPTGGVFGELEEPYYFDNRGFKLLPVNDFILGNRDVEAYSLDHTLELTVPQGAAASTTLSITTRDIGEIHQSDLVPIPLPTQDHPSAFRLELRSGETTLKRPAQAQLRFDFIRLQRQMAVKLGLGSASCLLTGNQELLNEAIEEEIAHYSLFRYIPEYERWLRIEARPSRDPEGHLLIEPYIRPPKAANQNQQLLRSSSVRVDPASAQLGEWAIVFFDDTRYHVYFKRLGARKSERLEQVGKIGKEFQDPLLGISLFLNREQRVGETSIPFAFGDTFTFKTIEDETGTIQIADLQNTDQGQGTVFIEAIPPSDEGAFVPGNWLLFFTDEDTYELRDSEDQPVLLPRGTAVRGRVGSQLRLAHLGLQILVQPEQEAFSFGDTITFATTLTGSIVADISELGAVALLRHSDTKPPNVILWSDGQEFQDGIEVPPRPAISLLIEDGNGVVPSSITLEQSKDGGPFEAVLPELAIRDVTTISMTYHPILFRGNYVYQISAQDFNGNVVQQDGQPFLTYHFVVTRDPDLEPPHFEVFINETHVSLPDEATSSAPVLIDVQPQIRVLVRDNEAVEPSTIRFSFGSPEHLLLLQQGEYGKQISGPEEVILDYTPDLVNGEYRIQVEAADISANASGPQSVSFVLQEQVTIDDLLNVPNPFQDSTVFSFTLTQEPDSLIVKIYSVNGRLLRTLEAEDLRRGHNELYWDGRDEAGDPIANGIYLYRLIMHADGQRTEKVGKAAILR